MLDIKTEKQRLRRKYKEIRRNISLEEKKLFDEAIFQSIISSQLYKSAKQILCFVSMDIEVDTRNLINQAFVDKKAVAVPKCIDKNGTMEFYYISSFIDLEESNFSLLEPNIYKANKVENFDNSICIVPGLCFDNVGYRIGFGKGFYDRFLSKYSEKKVGLCYNNCITKKLPHDCYDISVDYVVTQTGILLCNT